MATYDVSPLMNQLDRLIIQHLNYLDRLDMAIKKRVEFVHKKATECDFGVLFYSTVWPQLEAFPPDVKSIIVDIEQGHKTFHETAAQVNTVQPTQDNVDATSACKLILKLYRLEEVLKKQ